MIDFCSYIFKLAYIISPFILSIALSIILLYIFNFSLNINNLDIKYSHKSGIPNAIFSLILLALFGNLNNQESPSTYQEYILLFSVFLKYLLIS